MAQLTKKAILRAFLDLLEERPFERITVRDIVVECGITRNTFYYHFEDVYAVLKELLATEAKRTSEKIGQSDRLEDCFLEAMSFVLEHKRAAYHICCSSRREELLRCLNAEAEIVIARFVEMVAGNTEVSAEDKKCIVRFYRSSLIGILIEWVDGGMRQDLSTEIRRIGRLLEGTTQLALSRSGKA